MAPDEPTIEPWDSFGQELYAYWQGDPDAVEIIERDDGPSYIVILEKDSNT